MASLLPKPMCTSQSGVQEEQEKLPRKPLLDQTVQGTDMHKIPPCFILAPTTLHSIGFVISMCTCVRPSETSVELCHFTALHTYSVCCRLRWFPAQCTLGYLPPRISCQQTTYISHLKKCNSPEAARTQLDADTGALL